MNQHDFMIFGHRKVLLGYVWMQYDFTSELAIIAIIARNVPLFIPFP